MHLKGAFNTVRHAVEPMLKQRYGRILLFSSGSGLGASGQANYSAAKEGMVGFSRALARELGPYGISSNAIYPGGATRMTASVPPSTSTLRAAAGIGGSAARATGPTEEQRRAQQDTPDGTPRDPLNNAPTTAWLCSEAGGQISGQVIGSSGWQASRYSIRQVTRSISHPTRWTVEELADVVPGHLTAGLTNPAPMPPPAED